MSDIDKLEAGRELDALIAEKVMGYSVRRGVMHYSADETMPWEVWDKPGAERPMNPTPYSTNIAAAWQVIETLQQRWIEEEPVGLYWHFYWDLHFWVVSISHHEDEALYTEACDVSFPLAVCRAALKAVQRESNE